MPDTSTQRSERSPVGRAETIWLLVVILSAVVLYLRTFAYCWKEWNQESQYSLAFLVPFVSGYFLWKAWPQVRMMQRTPSAWGLMLIVAALLMHVGGTVLDISGPSSVSIILYLVGACIYFRFRIYG